MEKTQRELAECKRCYAMVTPGNLESHHMWHLKVEPDLEEPKGPGFWDLDGNWNRTSHDW